MFGGPPNNSKIFQHKLVRNTLKRFRADHYCSMTCIHNLDEILKFYCEMFLKGFQIYQNYLCALKLC